MGANKVVEVLNGYRGTITASVEAEGVTPSWTVTDDAILGGVSSPPLQASLWTCSSPFPICKIILSFVGFRDTDQNCPCP